MKFRVTKNSPKLLKEALTRRSLSNAINVIEEILNNIDMYDVSDEDVKILDAAYSVLFDMGPGIKENLKEAANGRVRLYVEFYPYERYGGGSGLKKATVSGTDELDALKKLVDHMGLYIDSEEIEEEGYSFEDCINNIAMSNGDGCDFVVVLKNMNSGEIYFQENYEEEEDWDDEFDESLKEAKEVNLSDKSNSISGLLLSGKDRIDAATSQPELIKVCSDILADKGGAKAQQFLSVLKTKKNHYAALKYVYDFILAGEGMRSPDSQRKSKSVQRREALQRGESLFEDNRVTEDELIQQGFQRVSGRRGYDFYRKLVDGKGKWYAAKDGEVIPITYDQARGYEPLNSEEKMAMTLGRKLLPHS